MNDDHDPTVELTLDRHLTSCVEQLSRLARRHNVAIRLTITPFVDDADEVNGDVTQ